MSMVLIVDDEPEQLSTLREILGEEEYDYGTADSGAAAMAFLRSSGRAVDAILLDWVLRDADGIELLRWIKKQPELCDVEVVIQSAKIIPEKIRAGIDCGAYYYLTKPYDRAQLQAIVKTAVSSCRMKRTIVQEVDAASDTLRMLDQGRFLVKTPHDAQTLAVRLAAACNDPDRGVGLNELLLNAIEHGNLGIDYDGKTRLLEEGIHQLEIQRRLEMPENKNKRVAVTLKRDEEFLQIEICDCGPGFDYRKYLTVDPARMFDTHGRGILVAGSLLKIEYIEPGNEVRVSIPLED